MSYVKERRFPRVASKSAVRLFSQEFTHPGPGQMLIADNINLGGCTLFTPAPLCEGQLVIANLALDAVTVRTIVRILYESKTSDGYEAGVEFLFFSPEDYESLNEFIDRRLQKRDELKEEERHLSS